MAVKKETKKDSVKKQPAKSKTAVKDVAPEVKASETVIEEKETASSKSKVAKKITGKYFVGVGRRKTSVAQVRIYENAKATEADIVVNDREMKDYFASLIQQNVLLAPLKETGMYGKFAMTVLVT